MARGPKTTPLAERFWKYIDKRGPVPGVDPGLGNCWLWTGPVAKKLDLGRWKGEDGKMVLAHRSAYEIQVGPIPEGHNVFQRCLNKMCMRGTHLTTGTKNSGPRQERPTAPPDKGRYASKHWKDIPGFPGYEASDQGEIRSWWVHGRSHYAHRPKVLKQTRVKSGYFYVLLIGPKGERRNMAVHLLVLTAFRGPRPPGKEGRHFPDRDQANSKLSNLSWATHQENMDDRHTHGTVPRGETHYSKTKPELVSRGEQHWACKNPERVIRGSAHANAKLTPEGYDRVVELLQAGVPQAEISRLVGINQAVVSHINTGKRQR